MQNTLTKLTTDFDRIAEVDNSRWDNNAHFHKFIIESLPLKIDKSLDIGSGKGIFTKLLAERSGEVTGIDVSAKMIHCALEGTREFTNVKLIIGDITSWDIKENYYDAVVSIAALHHMDIDTVLPKIISSLKKNGTLIIVDLYKSGGFIGFVYSLISLPYAFLLRIARTKRLFYSKQVRDAWNEHCRDDEYTTMKEINETAAKFMRGAEIKRHLLWRYSLTWKKI